MPRTTRTARTTHERSRSLTTHAPRGSFEEAAFAACFLVSASLHTRRGYWSDLRHWLRFCEEVAINPATPTPIDVVKYAERMQRDTEAPKTRVRRLAACSSVYERLHKDGKLTVVNPFSPEHGPKREKAHPIRPTPLAAPATVEAALNECAKDPSPFARRDEAILHILWATGARRCSLVEFTFERLARDGNDFVTTVPQKGPDPLRLLIQGEAATALAAWLAALDSVGVTSGPIFLRKTKKPMEPKDIWRAVRRWAPTLSPHTFRVAFLTINKASVEARQLAAGHRDMETTKLYDRSWRGREAFEAMPSPREAAEAERQKAARRG